MGKINENELRELFIKIKHNNKIAFEKLYNQYNKLVYGIAFSILKNKTDSEDIVQIVFTKIYSIDKSKLPSSKEASWLYTITKNESIRFLNNKKNVIDVDSIYEIEDTDNEINKIIDRDSYNRLISKLNDKEKEVVSLKIISNLSFEEIAKILNVPVGTVKWRYYKSINTLKILLSNFGMFIISFISSVIAFKNGAKLSDSANQEISDIENNNNLREDEEIKGSPTEEKKENIFLDKEEQTEQNTIVEIPVLRNNTNYIGISLITISTIFLIITIIFSIIFTKHQLKRKKKVSK